MDPINQWAIKGSELSIEYEFMIKEKQKEKEQLSFQKASTNNNEMMMEEENDGMII